VIVYGYDKKGRKAKQTVWDSNGNSHVQYEAHYEYDYRDQLRIQVLTACVSFTIHPGLG